MPSARLPLTWPGLVQQAQADGGIRPDADPRAIVLFALAAGARQLRAAAMPAGLEPAVTALTLDALASPAATAPRPLPGAARRARQP